MIGIVLLSHRMRTCSPQTNKSTDCCRRAAAESHEIARRPSVQRVRIADEMDRWRTWERTDGALNELGLAESTPSSDDSIPSSSLSRIVVRSITASHKSTAVTVRFIPWLMYRDVISVSTSRSRDAPTSRLGLGYLRLVPKTLFCPNFANQINKMSQISSRYYGNVNTNRE